MSKWSNLSHKLAEDINLNCWNLTSSVPSFNVNKASILIEITLNAVSQEMMERIEKLYAEGNILSPEALLSKRDRIEAELKNKLKQFIKTKGDANGKD